MTEHWAVIVCRNDEEIVTIESNCLSGRDLTVADEQTIRTAAHHLLSFIGDPCIAWRPVSEAADQSAAPWDGVPVLILTNHNWGGPTNRVHRAFWTDEIHGSGIFGWAVHDCKFGPYPLRGYTQVTHWMPLPVEIGQ